MRTYNCNYCGIVHDDDSEPEGIEHIIPEAMLNASEKLRHTCARWNNFFAVSFESPVIRSRFVQEVLRIVDPGSLSSKKEIYLGSVETARGTIEHRWMKEGKEFLRDLPKRRTATRIPYEAFDAKGESHDIKIELPFALVESASGAPDAVAKVSERIDKQRQQLSDYLVRVAADPSIDPELDGLLRENNWTVRAPKSVGVSTETRSGGDEVVVTDILPKLYPLNREQWVRFYLKVGWCFACKNLGRQLLEQLESEILLAHLKAGTVCPSIVSSAVTDNPAVAKELFRSARVKDVDVWFWDADPSKAHEYLEQLTNPALSNELDAALRERVEQETAFARWVDFTQVGSIDESVMADSISNRVHVLRLEWVSASDCVALVCHITLFGDAFRATAQLTPLRPTSVVKERLRLAGTDFDGLPRERRIVF